MSFEHSKLSFVSSHGEFSITLPINTTDVGDFFVDAITDARLHTQSNEFSFDMSNSKRTISWDFTVAIKLC